MPIKDCQSNGKPGKKWGDSGKCFTGKDAEEKARKQGQAIELSKKRKGEKSEFDKAFFSKISEKEQISILVNAGFSTAEQAQFLLELKNA